MSIYLAQLLGPTMVVASISLLINGNFYAGLGDELQRNRLMILVAGMAALVGGTAMVLAHNLWVADWRIILTVFGWVMVAAGLVRLLAPEFVLSIGERMLVNRTPLIAAGTLWGVLGLVLCYFGYLT